MCYDITNSCLVINSDVQYKLFWVIAVDESVMKNHQTAAFCYWGFWKALSA